MAEFRTKKAITTNKKTILKQLKELAKT